MYKKNKKQAQNADLWTNYRKHTEEGFPRRIQYIQLAGPYIPDIQLNDIIFDQKDIEMRFPKRNKKLLKEAGL